MQGGTVMERDMLAGAYPYKLEPGTNERVDDA